VHRGGTTNSTPNTTGTTLDQLVAELERITFADPATHQLREQWEDTKREVQALFETACTEEYEGRLGAYRAAGAPDAEERARREADLIRPMLEEERERRLTMVWAEVLRRVKAVLAGKDATPESGGSTDCSATTTSPRERQLEFPPDACHFFSSDAAGSAAAFFADCAVSRR
jgi:hypothetical protein